MKLKKKRRKLNHQGILLILFIAAVTAFLCVVFLLIKIIYDFYY